jgi:hypothetical protein
MLENAKPTLDFGLGWVYLLRKDDGGERGNQKPCKGDIT